MKIECLLNPGVFRFENKIWLLLRVAERPVQEPGQVSFPVLKDGNIEILHFRKDDPYLDATDPMVINYKGKDYLTTLSHLYSFGMLLSGISMVFMMTLGEINAFGVGFAGLIMGSSFGFFWANRDFLALNTTNDNNRNYYYGLETKQCWAILLSLIDKIKRIMK